MKLSEIYNKKNIELCKPIISFEVFPPKDDLNGEKLKSLFSELEILKKYQPKLISVTYGAGGSTQDKTLEIVSKIKNDLGMTPMPHFTCVCTTYKNIKHYLSGIKELGIKNILALRGDIPDGCLVSNDFQYASDLVEFIKKETNLSIAVAGYPEKHKDAITLESDIKNLKNKVEKGADVIFTQLFFDNSYFYNYLEKIKKMDIQKPVSAGVLPIISYKQIERMANLCCTTIPKHLINKIEKNKDDNNYIKELGIEYATEQCLDLIKNGVDGLHFYTLNKSFSTSRILSNIKLSKKTRVKD